MFGITISDTKQSGGGVSSLSFDLRDILAAVGEPVLSSHWRCCDLYYTTMRDGRLSEFDEARRELSGEEMLQFAAGVHQIIDGRFEAHDERAAKSPWLIILAVDSSWFEVWSSERETLDRVRSQFAKVSDLPDASA